MKLKTSKDLIIPQHISYVSRNVWKDVVFPEDLKKEAIKWVKELKYAKKIYFPELDITEDLHNLVAWIKYFFNITEKDLK